MTSRYQLAFDIGGTFTDFVLLDGTTGQLHIHKALTTPHDPAEGALEGLQLLLDRAGASFAEVGVVVHGSTIVTNLVIERKGAVTALLTTRGFRDVIEFGSEQRYDIHDIFLKFPEPFVPRARRFEVTERLSRDGDVVTPLDLDEVLALTRQAVQSGVKAIAIVFLHAYRNPAHEQAAAAHIRAHFPEIEISISSEVCAEIREYERATTTTANAYAQPIVAPYVARLEQALAARGFTGRFTLMQSSGALASPEMARRLPVRLLESGPAGGGLAAAHFGKVIGKPDLIAFDMGGTTAKVCLIQEGKADIAPMLEAAREHRFKKGSGLPIRAPVIDLIEIGAGGGSIAALDEIGLLKVGPHSAGAMPGPACYGRGGTLPTVTDANLLLGYLAPGSFLGGRLTLDSTAAEAAFAPLAARLDKSAAEAAWGVFAVVCENMAGAARVHVVEKGRDPRSFAMVAFGGAGPAHAVRVAKSLGVGSVIVPPASGAASAFGFLGGAVAHEAARSMPALLSGEDWGPINAALAALEAEGQAMLATAGIVADRLVVTREAELRLAGQIHDLRIPVPAGPLGEGTLAALRTRFAAAYRLLYAREPTEGVLEVMSWRVTCAEPTPTLAMVSLAGGGAPVEPTAPTLRPAWFPESGGFVQTPVHSRYALAAGTRLAGPVIIEENESTTIIPPGDTVEVDAHGNLVISLAPAATLLAAEGDGFDPISLEIMWSRLITISEECWLTVIRTAFSLLIGETQDFACEILDARGQPLAHSPRAMPVFNISLMTAVQSLLEVYPPETLVPGDVLITNDPWVCAGHLFDVAVVSPVFHKGRVVAFIGSVGHVTDIGGTRDKANARELFDEGLQIPAMKLFRAGVANDDLLRMITQNVRNPRQVIGDIHALVAANALGAERLDRFMEEYGLRDLAALAAAIQARAENAVRDAVRQVPDGVYTAETSFTVSGEPHRLPAKVTVKGDDIEVDYEGCPPQLARGGVNCTLTVTRAETLFALKCIFSPGIRATAGCYRPFEVKAPPGSLYNASRPASVALRRLTMWYLVGTIFRALSDVLPERVQAFTGLPSLLDLYGIEPDGTMHTDHVFVGGGQGGSARQDGSSGVIWPTSAANASVEMVESRLPVLVLEKSLIADSGGIGKHRGGLGQRVRVRRLFDGPLPFFATVYPEGANLTTDGLHGGAPGGHVRAFLTDLRSGERKELTSSTMLELKDTAEVVEMVLGGGAGFGPSSERDPALVASDLANGYISVAPASPLAQRHPETAEA